MATTVVEVKVPARVKSVTVSGRGTQGPRGYDAYQVAVQNGYVGTVSEWLESLKAAYTEANKIGDPGDLVETFEIALEE